MINALLQKIISLGRDARGNFAVELALAVPVMAALVLSGVEVTRFVMLNQKLERTSVSVADLISQAESLTVSDIDNVFLATSGVMSPFDLLANGTIIVSSVSAEGGSAPQVNWQRAYGEPGNTSAVGAAGAGATLPPGFVVRDNESVIVAEVLFDYTPLIVDSVIGNKNLYNFAVFRPRFGSLTSLN